MSLNLDITNLNKLTGVSIEKTGDASISHIRYNDKMRLLWKQILKPLTTESFIRSVIEHPDYAVKFSFDIKEEEFWDFHWNKYVHVASYQNLSQTADPTVPLRLVPWQIRFEFSPSVLPTALMLPFAFKEELLCEFENAGWTFWFTETGFCIAPLHLFREVRSISTMYESWVGLRDYRGAGFTNFPTENNKRPSELPPLEEITSSDRFNPKVIRVNQSSSNAVNTMDGSGRVRADSVCPSE